MFEWHCADCHSHVLRFPLISTSNNSNDYSSSRPTICVIVWCQTQALTFAVLSAGVYKYKHICLSYWPLSPHFLDSLLPLLTIQTHGTTRNLSFTEHFLSSFSPLSLSQTVSFALSAALAICLNKTGQTMVTLISAIFLSLQISWDNIIRAIQWLLFRLGYTDISSIQYSFDMLALGESIVSVFVCSQSWFHHKSGIPEASYLFLWC